MSNVMEKFVKNSTHINKQLMTVLTEKFRMYGHENILGYGKRGVHMRMQDKFSRLGNMLDGAKPKTSESEFDTWLDIAGYAIIGMMLHDGVWPGQNHGEGYTESCEEHKEYTENKAESLPVTRSASVFSVYMAGPVDQSERRYVAPMMEMIKNHSDKIVAFFPQKCYCSSKDADMQFVKDVNYMALAHANGILAYVPNNEVTVGTIFEIVFALQAKKKIAVVTDLDVIPIYFQNPAIKVFRDTQHAIEYLTRG